MCTNQKAGTASIPVSNKIKESLVSLEALADEVDSFCYDKLIPITDESVNKKCSDTINDCEAGQPYPPLFEEYRKKIYAIECSLRRIKTTLEAAEI